MFVEDDLDEEGLDDEDEDGLAEEEGVGTLTDLPLTHSHTRVIDGSGMHLVTLANALSC